LLLETLDFVKVLMEKLKSGKINTKQLKQLLLNLDPETLKKLTRNSLEPQNESGDNDTCGNGDGSEANSKVTDITAHKKKRASRAGKGRYGFDDYPDSTINNIEIEDKAAGDRCTSCHHGKLYNSEARKLLQFTGNAPITISRHQKAVLRCNTCGLEFMSHKQINKWDDMARSSIVLQRIYGMPHYRLSKLQSLYNTPIAESTLWLQCLGLWEECGSHIYKQLMRVALDSKLFYCDDTGAKILEVIQANKLLPKNEKGRSCHTTNICTTTAKGDNIILYITDNRYYGENFANIMTNRSNRDHYIKLMTDASSSNTAGLDEQELGKVIVSNCLTHGQRKFANIEDYYPQECGYFLNEIRLIYKTDNECRNYDTRKRLKCHKQHSSEHIGNIYRKIDYLYRQKLVEPNSVLGKAMNYWLNNKWPDKIFKD
jgi:transposase